MDAIEKRVEKYQRLHRRRLQPRRNDKQSETAARLDLSVIDIQILDYQNHRSLR